MGNVGRLQAHGQPEGSLMCSGANPPSLPPQDLWLQFHLVDADLGAFLWGTELTRSSTVEYSTTEPEHFNLLSCFWILVIIEWGAISEFLTFDIGNRTSISQ